MNHDELVASNAALNAQALRTREGLRIAHLTIDKPKTEIAYLRRIKFGRSSEQLEHAGQLQPMDGATGAPPAQGATNTALGEHGLAADGQHNLIDLQHERRKRRARKAHAQATEGVLPAHLPRRTIMHAPPGQYACGACDARREIGADVSEQLDTSRAASTYFRHGEPRVAPPAWANTHSIAFTTV
ncbi:MAG: hypothetical protein NDJ19_14785 [Ramlibacter sp.]|nr:hypothetical protein [Ramlibacter sp.]